MNNMYLINNIQEEEVFIIMNNGFPARSKVMQAEQRLPLRMKYLLGKVINLYPLGAYYSQRNTATEMVCVLYAGIIELWTPKNSLSFASLRTKIQEAFSRQFLNEMLDIDSQKDRMGCREEHFLHNEWKMQGNGSLYWNHCMTFCKRSQF